MPLTLNEQVVDALTIEEAKSIVGMSTVAANLATQNAVANQQNVQAFVSSNLQNAMLMSQNAMQNGVLLAQAGIARAVRFTLDTSAEQAAAFDRQLSADVSGRLMNIEASLSGGQQAAKIAQSTAPQTGTGGAFGSETGLSQQIGLAVTGLAQQLSAIQAMLSNVKSGP